MRQFSIAAFVALYAAVLGFNSDVHDLKADSFLSFVEGYDLVLAKFFAPWCEHCKRLAPEYEKAATALKKQNISLIRVDCTEELELCENYEVQGYPALKVFRGLDDITSYPGARTAPAIISYMNRQANPAVSILTSKTIEEFKIADRVVLVAFCASNDRASIQSFHAVAVSLRHDFSFGLTSDPALAKSEGIQQPGVVLYKDFDEGKNVYEGLFNVTAITKFAKTASTPLFGELGPESYANYLEADIPLAHVFAETQEERASLAKELKRLAERYKNRINFVTVDAIAFGAHAANLNLEVGKWPAFGILDTSKKFPFIGTKISEKNIGKFVKDFFDGKIEPTVKSEPIPEKNNGPVTVIVAHTYDDLVFDDKKDVLVQFYAPWSWPTLRLQPDYDSKITIAKVDVTSNDVPDDIEGFPTIKLFPAGAKDAPVIYSGVRAIDDLVLFIKTHGKYQVDAFASNEPSEDDEIAYAESKIVNHAPEATVASDGANESVKSATDIMAETVKIVSQFTPKQDLISVEPMGAAIWIVRNVFTVGDFDKVQVWFTILCVCASTLIVAGMFLYLRRLKDRRGYVYKPLDMGSKEIRLLRILQSANHESIVRCRVRHVLLSESLSENPVYAALSYYWGDHSEMRVIELNGFTVHVTANLEGALRQMRRNWTTIDIWIDALCIDQKSKSERSSQVLRMFAIYQKARVVAVWLGPEAQGSDKVMRMLSHDQGASHSYDYGERFSRPFFEDNGPPTSEEVRDFLLRPYWYRIWIIQEIIAAKEICVLCGDWTIEIKDIARLLSDLVAKDLTSATQPSPVKQLFDIRNLRRDQKPIGLLDALRRTSYCSSSEVLDKVYGLLGMVHDSSHFMTEPDYRLSPTQLCRIMTRNAIIETGSLDIILLGGLHAKSTNLPSWSPNYFSVADWDPYVIKFLLREHSLGRRNTAGDTRISSSTILADKFNGILRVRGVNLGPMNIAEGIIRQFEHSIKLREILVEEEHCGYADSAIESGDRIYILHGCSTTVILRPVAGHEKRFKFLNRFDASGVRDTESEKVLSNDARWIELC